MPLRHIRALPATTPEDAKHGRIAAMRVDGNRCAVLNVLKSGHLTPDRNSSDTVARHAILGWEDCVYLFLGRADDCYGHTAFAISRDAIPISHCAFTPFDSGFVHQGREASGMARSPDTARADFIQANRGAGSDLATLFGRFIHVGYSSPVEYLEGKRPAAIDAQLYTSATSWRAWTWELQIAAPIPLNRKTVLRWSTPVFTELRRQAIVDPILARALRALPRPIVPSLGDRAFREFDLWQRTAFAA